MKNTNIALIRDIIIGLIGLATAIVVTMKTMKEQKLRKAAGLKANPERCKEHADRISALEESKGDILRAIGENKAATEAVGKNVEKLLNLHMKE